MKKIYFIRHGEKKSDPIHLSKTGLIRANELPKFLLDFLHLQIDHIVAMKQVKKDKSNRPFETVWPIATKLNLTVIDYFERDSVKEVCHYLQMCPFENILVCWEHSVIPEIVSKYLETKAALAGGKEIHHKKLHWGLNPLKDEKDSDDDYTALWEVSDNSISVHREFEVCKNGEIDYKKCAALDVFDFTN